jgi:hypothetical protein
MGERLYRSSNMKPIMNCLIGGGVHGVENLKEPGTRTRIIYNGGMARLMGRAHRGRSPLYYLADITHGRKTLGFVISTYSSMEAARIGIPYAEDATVYIRLGDFAPMLAAWQEKEGRHGSTNDDIGRRPRR